MIPEDDDTVNANSVVLSDMGTDESVVLLDTEMMAAAVSKENKSNR